MASTGQACPETHSRASVALQNDNFLPTLTAKETLMFYANLLLPPGMPAAERDERVGYVMEVLGLTAHAKTLVRCSTRCLCMYNMYSMCNIHGPCATVGPPPCTPIAMRAVGVGYAIEV
jgi:hypothetical protein